MEQVSLYFNIFKMSLMEWCLAMTTSNQEYSHASRLILEKLPHSYTNVPPVAMSKMDTILPKLAGPNKADCLLMSQASKYDWLEHVREVISRDKLGNGEQISWSA